MSTIRVNKNENYTVMSNCHLKDSRLSLKAKGLLSIMLSLSDGWHYSIGGLVAICKENETAIKSTLSELKTYGYLVVTKKLPNETESGRFEYVYDIYEQPQEKQGIENLYVEFQGVENQDIENQGGLNTNKSSTNVLNTNKSITNDRGKEPIDPKQLVALYNQTCPSLPPVEYITVNRTLAATELSKTFTMEQMLQCFRIAESSKFLNGQNPRRWKATFDWLTNPDNVAKVLEGNFTDDNGQASSSFDTEAFFQAALESSYFERKAQ